MSAETSKKPAKVGMIETFLSGAKKGWGIAINTIMPAMVLGYVLVQVFNVTGVMDVLGNICGPIMGVFGLPGEAIAVLISAFFAKAAGAATAFNLYHSGTGDHLCNALDADGYSGWSLCPYRTGNRNQ